MKNKSLDTNNMESNLENNLENNLDKNKYPSLLKRVKAAITDVFVMVLFMYGMSELFSMFENVSGNLRMFAFLFIFVLYDPIFISLFGGTIGHLFIGIRVKKENDVTKNISFPAAFLRFLIKSTLGWISFLTMSSSEKKMAIHDNAVNSVVIFE